MPDQEHRTEDVPHLHTPPPNHDLDHFCSNFFSSWVCINAKSQPNLEYCSAVIYRMSKQSDCSTHIISHHPVFIFSGPLQRKSTTNCKHDKKTTNPQMLKLFCPSAIEPYLHTAPWPNIWWGFSFSFWNPLLSSLLVQILCAVTGPF